MSDNTKQMKNGKAFEYAKIHQYIKTLDSLGVGNTLHENKGLNVCVEKSDDEAEIQSVLNLVEEVFHNEAIIRYIFKKELEQLEEESGFNIEYHEGFDSQDDKVQLKIIFNSSKSEKWKLYIGPIRESDYIGVGMTYDKIAYVKPLPKYKIRYLSHWWSQNDKDQEYPMGWSYLRIANNEYSQHDDTNTFQLNKEDVLYNMRNGSLINSIRNQVRFVKNYRIFESLIEIENKTKHDIDEEKKNLQFIEFDGLLYPCRDVWYEDGCFTVSTLELESKLYNNETGYTSKDAEWLDEQIFFYVDSDKIQLPQRKLQRLIKECMES